MCEHGVARYGFAARERHRWVKERRQGIVRLSVLACVGLAILCAVGCSARVTPEIPYSPDFLDLVRTGRVQKVEIRGNEGGRGVAVVAVAPVDGTGQAQAYRVEIPPLRGGSGWAVGTGWP